MTDCATLASLIGARLEGEAATCVQDVASLGDATHQHISFVEKDKPHTDLADTGAAALIVTDEFSQSLPEAVKAVLRVADPQAAFITAMLHFRPQPARPELGVSPQAHVSETAKVGSGCNIHPGAHVADDAVIGSFCDIYPGAYVGPGVRVGDHTVIHPNAVLYPGGIVGSSVHIHAGAVIAKPGFGFRFVDGRFERIPHTGVVRIEDDVEIGAGTTIDRAMIGETVIGTGTRLDNQIQIGHNCRLGRHNAYAAQVGFAGSVQTGDYVRCAGQAGVADHAEIEQGATLGAKAGVHGRVPAGETYHGSPAGPERDQMRMAMAYQKLPELRAEIRRLRKEVDELKQFQSPETTKDAA